MFHLEFIRWKSLVFISHLKLKYFCTFHDLGETNTVKIRNMIVRPMIFVIWENNCMLSCPLSYFFLLQELQGMNQNKGWKWVTSPEYSFTIWGNVTIFQLCFSLPDCGYSFGSIQKNMPCLSLFLKSQYFITSKILLISFVKENSPFF